MLVTPSGCGTAPFRRRLAGGLMAVAVIAASPSDSLADGPDGQTAAQSPDGPLSSPIRPHLIAVQDVDVLEPIPQAAGSLTPPIDEATARRILAEWRLLVLPQQKKRALELIRQYPNTRLAEIARQFLAEYELYDAAQALDRRLEKAHSLRIRAFWDARRPVHRPFVPPQIRITNRSDEAVLYQVKTYETDWLGPYLLPPGEMDTFNSCLLYRRLTREGTQLHSLWPGSDYVFVKLAPDAPPRLFEN